MTATVLGLTDMMELETPKKSEQSEQTTPRRSERKRALFPSASPQTSDLGHMSPLGSSPDRFSSAPASPDSATFSPLRKSNGPVSPFGRRVSASNAGLRCSPRKRFSLLLSSALNDKPKNHSTISKITPLNSKDNKLKYQPLEASDKLSDIVPADQLEQTILSVMDESDGPESPHSEHTPGNKVVYRASSDIATLQPLTPSKRRSLLASGSGSTTSVSPESPECKHRLSLEGRSKSAGAELPRARTSLFSGHNNPVAIKRSRDDGIYLTGRNMKRRKTYGEINAGVRTGIRRPPKVKPKSNKSSSKKTEKVTSVWDVGPKSTLKRKSLSPNKAPKMSLLAKPVKRTDKEIAALSASTSIQVRSKRQNTEMEDTIESEDDIMEPESPAPVTNNRFFKTKVAKARTAVITLGANIRIKMHKGRFLVDKSPPAPPAKRRRKLYSHEKQIQAIKDFDDNDEDVAADTRGEVQNILQKLEEDKNISPESFPIVNNSLKLDAETVDAKELCSYSLEDEHPQLEKTSLAAPNSPPRIIESRSDGLLSPLSQLASCTSTLSINVGGDTLQLTESQVQALSAVPDVIMEDDDLPLCEPLQEESSVTDDLVVAKENNICTSVETDSTPVKYFPIFDSNFSHQKLPVSPSLAKRKRSLLCAIGNDQYQLDAGQKRFGATECSTCSAIYQMGEPEDEKQHEEFHNALKNLKFGGWKNERVVGEYVKNRVIVIRPGDPKPWWSKASEVLAVVDKDLGFAKGVHCDPDHSMVYLYISDKTVIGCLLAIPVKKAHKMIETSVQAEGLDCCTAEEYPVKCGVSRIWVHRRHRQSGVARQLMDCMRKTFIFGHVLSVEEIAFSSPTVEGKNFAEHYTGCKEYFVYTQI